MEIVPHGSSYPRLGLNTCIHSVTCQTLPSETPGLPSVDCLLFSCCLAIRYILQNRSSYLRIRSRVKRESDGGFSEKRLQVFRVNIESTWTVLWPPQTVVARMPLAPANLKGQGVDGKHLNHTALNGATGLFSMSTLFYRQSYDLFHFRCVA